MSNDVLEKMSPITQIIYMKCKENVLVHMKDLESATGKMARDFRQKKKKNGYFAIAQEEIKQATGELLVSFMSHGGGYMICSQGEVENAKRASAEWKKKNYNAIRNIKFIDEWIYEQENSGQLSLDMTNVDTWEGELAMRKTVGEKQ